VGHFSADCTAITNQAEQCILGGLPNHQENVRSDTLKVNGYFSKEPKITQDNVDSRPAAFHLSMYGYCFQSRSNSLKDL
jgi:hypothetical protein